jgi:ATP-binding cassette subfamily B multidrug efflux pump
MKTRHRGALEGDGVPGKVFDWRLMKRVWVYARPYRSLILLSLLLIFGVASAQLVQPYLIKLAIDDQISQGRMDGLGGLALVFLAALVTEFLLRYCQLLVLQRTGQYVIFDIRNAMFEHLQRLPSAYFDRHPVGRLITRLTSDVEALNEVFTSGLVMILADLVRLFGIVAILLWMDWRLALITFSVLPPAITATWFFRVRIRAVYRIVRERMAAMASYLQENVSGMRVVQLFARERASVDQFNTINAEHCKAQLGGVRYESIFSSLAELLGSVTLAAILWFAGHGILAGLVTFGTLVAFIEYAAKFFHPVQQLSMYFTSMQAAMTAAERIFALLDTPVTIESPSNPRRISGALRGEIVFENVTFGYKPDEPVLRNISFCIKPGENVAVVGWTGAGKSTLIRLLVRLYDVWEGRILIDGVDVRDYDLQDLRRSVSVVLQDHFLFAGTVESNITLGDPSVTAERARAAAVVVDASQFIDRLPDGYAEPVREKGSNFSMGERQLISFARAVAFDPRVLVLDEATASVDPETETRIRHALDTVLEGRTSIIIAHRLATIRDADRVLVLHHGELVEQGTHDELLELEKGIYRTLHSLQTVPEY